MQIPLAFLVGAPGGEELLLIFVVVLSMFGPKKIPEIARNIGKAMEYLRRTSQEFREQVMRLDEEVPKVVDAALKDDASAAVTPPADTVNPPPITPGIDPYFPNHDPYNIYGDQATAEGEAGESSETVTTGEVPAEAAKESEVHAAAIIDEPPSAPVIAVEKPVGPAVQQQLELLDAKTYTTIEGVQEGASGSNPGDNVAPKNELAG